MNWALLVVPAIIICWFLVRLMRDLWRGYGIYRLAFDIIYKEWGKGSFKLDIEMCMSYLLVHVPSEAKWQAQMPDWAKARRHEIMQRLIKELAQDESIRFSGYDTE